MSEQDDLEAYNAELAAREEAEYNRSVETQINEAYDLDMARAELSTLRSRLAAAERERDRAVNLAFSRETAGCVHCSARAETPCGYCGSRYATKLATERAAHEETRLKLRTAEQQRDELEDALRVDRLISEDSEARAERAEAALVRIGKLRCSECMTEFTETDDARVLKQFGDAACAHTVARAFLTPNTTKPTTEDPT